MNFLINKSCYNKKYKNIIVEILGSSKGIFNSFFLCHLRILSPVKGHQENNDE